jgi:DNA-binding MarR family transcriptional regulator
MEYTRILFLRQQVYATLFSLANKLQVKGDQHLKYLTSRQLMTLIAIGHLPEDGASLNNIARKLGTTKQSAKQLITLLEKNGYVVIVPNQRDKRAINVVITEIGKRVLVEDGIRGMALFDDLFHDFSLEELEVIWSLLKKLYRYDGEDQDGFESEMNINQSTNGEF